MKAARLFGKNDLRVEQITTPQAGAGELLLRTACASVCGTDIRMLKHGHTVAPLIIGHEMSGTIEQKRYALFCCFPSDFYSGFCSLALGEAVKLRVPKER